MTRPKHVPDDQWPRVMYDLDSTSFQSGGSWFIEEEDRQDRFCGCLLSHLRYAEVAYLHGECASTTLNMDRSRCWTKAGSRARWAREFLYRIYEELFPKHSLKSITIAGVRSAIAARNDAVIDKEGAKGQERMAQLWNKLVKQAGYTEVAA